MEGTATAARNTVTTIPSVPPIASLAATCQGAGPCQNFQAMPDLDDRIWLPAAQQSPIASQEQRDSFEALEAIVDV